MSATAHMTPEQATLYLLTHDLEWPNKVLLPMKHSVKRDSTGFPMIGCLVFGRGWTIFLADMYTIMNSTVVLENIPTMKYDSVDALLADGWVVD